MANYFIGGTLICSCPFHDDNNPSFFWWNRTGTGYCFGCEAGPMDLIEFFAKMNDISYFQALIRLAKFYKVPLKWNKERLK